jgi:hypothetical protein
MAWSRRKFLQAGLLSSAVKIVPRDFWSLTLQSTGLPPPLFSKPDLIRYDSDCFTIHGADTFIFSMECPYPRVRPELWHDRFSKVRQAGFNTVDTYIFWNYHERRPGEFDFTELEQYLQLAKEFGFRVIVRPGPYVDAEFERGGFPAYVIAQRFPVRSMHPESLRSSKHWYDHVLPIIRRYQITEGGPIILVQIENEIDFTNLPEAEQKEYIRFLAQLAWDAGIEVPLISNVSSVVRERTDPDMARILDACDFYPRWSFLTDRELPTSTAGLTMEEKVGLSDRAVLASLRKMRKDEPNCPLSIAELGTGYYSKFGGKLSEDEEGTDALQTNALTKTIIESGVTYLNYYLGWGGTNFDWPAKGVTTTYDFAAPIREWGGLWDKYYTVRGIGVFLELFGIQIVRSRLVEKACHCSHPDVHTAQRVNGKSGFVFLRGNTDADHHYTLKFRDTASDAEHSFTIPHVGQLTLGPHRMKIMPVQVPITGAQLQYSTAEVLAYGRNGEHNFLIIYDEPGALVEIALEWEHEPDVTGEMLYRGWDSGAKSVVIGVRMTDRSHFLLIDRNLLVVALPRDLALRTWVQDFPTNGAAAKPGTNGLSVPFITDAYLLRSAGRSERRIWAEIDFLSGEHALTALLPAKPEKCRVDGAQKETHYNPTWHSASVEISTPELPAKPIDIHRVQSSVERFDTSLGQWTAGPARVLEELGPVPYGYVKYRAHFSYNNEAMMYISAFTDNDKKVFLNGKYVALASQPGRFVGFSPATYVQRGDNLVEISYELFGSTEFGEEEKMAELNGIEALRLGPDPQTATSIVAWQVQTLPPAMHGRHVDPNFSFGEWKTVSIGMEPSSGELVSAFTWCRAEFHLPPADPSWSIPWKLVLGSDRDALLYLNGKFVGRFSTAGPQREFYLPEPWLSGDGIPNLLTVVLAYAESTGHMRTLRVEPYNGYAPRRTMVEFEW